MLLVSLDESHRAEFWRGKAKPNTGKLTAVLPEKKAFLADLMSMHMGGFHSVPADAGRVSWTLDSCLLQQAAIH